MMKPGDKSATGGVLVSDFDGTMTQHDFYKLAIDRLLPPSVPDYWAQYRAGALTHFEALRSYFAAIRSSEEEVLAVVEQMELDPNLPDAVERLNQAGWKVIVASAGCGWYIQRLLSAAGVDIEVHANPGRFEAGGGSLMEMPASSAYFSPTLGVDKTHIVRSFRNQSHPVAFAGDGLPDAEPARLVSSEFLALWRGALADSLRMENLPYRPFHVWSEIADKLLRQESS